MIWLLGGYMWLFVHRPFEVWPSLGVLQIERGYMLVMILIWLVHPAKGLSSSRMHLALGLFTLVLLSTWVLSPYGAMPGCLDVVENFAKVSVFYVLVVTTVRDEKGLRLLMLLFLAAVGLYMAHSVVELMHGRYQWRMGIRRMIGVDVTYGDPNSFASTLLFTAPLLLPFWRERPRRIPRPLLAGYLACVLGCILLTGSRTAFAGMCLLGFLEIVGAARRKAQAVLVFGLAALLGFAVLSVALPEELQNRYLTLVDSTKGPKNAQESASGRFEGFIRGVQLWEQSPLVGHGPGAFPYASTKGYQAHNVYGQVLSETGVAGAAAFLVLVGCFLLNWREARRRALAEPFSVPGTNFAYQVSRGIGINVLLLLATGWAGHNLFRYNWQWFAAFSVVALACLRVRATTGDVSAYPSLPQPATARIAGLEASA
jgi:O-antigen ligase